MSEPEFTEDSDGVMASEPVSEFSDVSGEGMFRALELDEAQADDRAAEQQMTYAESLEWGRQANARCRQLESEIRVLRGEEPLPGFESGPATGGVETDELASGEGSWPNVDDTSPIVGGISSPLYDLVTEAVRALLPELLREVLPRPRAIEVYIQNEGMAKVAAEEVVAKLFPSLVLVVAQLAGRAARVSEEDGLWSMGVEDEIAHQMNQVARAAPRRVKEQIRSRTLT